MDPFFMSCLRITVGYDFPEHRSPMPKREMAPKKADAKTSKADAKTKKTEAAAEPIQMPNVSAKEVEDAQKSLQDHVERRRANSNMMYWLSQQGKRPNYDALTPKERKDFAIMWFA